MPEREMPGPVDNWKSDRSVLYTLPFRGARITGGFWGIHQHINRTVSLAHGYAMLEQAGNFGNLRIAAGMAEGEFMGYWFADSDVYKWLEAVGWELGNGPDPALQEMVDKTIALIEKAQLANGYLDSYFQIKKPEERWTDLSHGHELYCAGHLIQAAVAFQRSVGDKRLLAVALKFVDHIEELFGANGRQETAGHPEIEMALVELFRLTGDERHLDLAQMFIDRRGYNQMRGHAGYGSIYLQDHVPVREADEVVGHAVRQIYLTTGATDLYMERGEEALMEAMLTLWADMTQRKMYITGGLGSRFDGEAFGGPYELPSDTCYTETCAAIASLIWNWRLLLITGEGRYADLFERTLYNGVLSSPGLEGASYLYVNPLQVRGGRYVRASADTGAGEERMRPAWHNCACCPPNVMRLFSSLSHYLATTNESGVQLHQYGTAALNLDLSGEPLLINTTSDYPWDGQIKLNIGQSPSRPWTLSLRLPSWCKNYALTLNGAELPATLDEHGYLNIERTWQANDALVFDLEMEPQFLAPNPRIDALRGTVALQRGPLIYCLESHDQPDDIDLLDIEVVTTKTLTSTATDSLGGIVSVTLPGRVVTSIWEENLYRSLDELAEEESRALELTAVPYFVWGNRGMQSMRVWIPKASQGD